MKNLTLKQYNHLKERISEFENRENTHLTFKSEYELNLMFIRHQLKIKGYMYLVFESRHTLEIKRQSNGDITTYNVYTGRWEKL